MRKSIYLYLIFGLIILCLCGYFIYNSYSNNEKEEKQIVEYQAFFNEIDSLIYGNPLKFRSILLNKQKEIISSNYKVNVKILTRLALTYFLESEFQQSLALFNEAIEIGNKNNDIEGTAILYDYMATVFLEIGDYSEANINYLKAQKIYSRINDDYRESYVLNNMGVLYLYLGNIDKALENINQAITITQKIDNKKNLGFLYTNKAAAYYRKNEYDSAHIYADMAINVPVEKSSYYYLTIAYNIKGKVCFKIDDFKLSRCFLTESLYLARKDSLKRNEINTLISFGDFFLKQEMIDSALIYSNLALDNLILFDSNYQQLERVNSLYRNIYKKAGDIEKTLFYTEELLKLHDKETEDNKAHEIYNLQLNQIAEQKLAADNKIESQNHLLKNKNVIIIITVCVLLLVLILYIYHQKKQYNEILLLTKRKNKAAIESEVLERGRIGKELHDGLGQILTVIRLNLSLLLKNTISTNNKENDYLKNAISGVDDVFAEINNIIENLAPIILVSKGLEKALRKIVTEINKTKKVRLQLEIFGFETKQDSLIENVLYRSIQELINNGIKHSNASEINIQLVKGDEEITLMVEDNGIGFDYSIYKNNIGGHGLNNISTRVKNLNGQFYVDSQTKRGSIITIIIPIN